MQAVGIYVRELREAHGLTQLEVASAVGTNTTYIWRVESGTLENPGIDLMMRIVEAVHGRGDHLMKLILAERPTEALARALAAEARLSPAETEQVAKFLTSDVEVRKLLESVYEAAHNPVLRGRLRGYLDSLMSGDAPGQTPPVTSRRKRRG